MTIPDLIHKLCQRFSRYAAEIESWAPSYKRMLGHASGPDLERAWRIVADSWDGSGYPKPRAFAEHLPAQATNSDINGVAIDHALKQRRAEVRGFVDRTFAAHTLEIEQRAAAFSDQPCNAYRACVTAYVESLARQSAWYRRYKPAPHHADLTAADFERFDANAKRVINRPATKALVGYQKDDAYTADRRRESIDRASHSAFDRDGEAA